MSFWSAVGKSAKAIGKFVAEEAKAATDRSKQYKLDMLNKQDSELFKIIELERSTSPLMAGVAKRELENRGYSQEEIVEKIRE